MGLTREVVLEPRSRGSTGALGVGGGVRSLPCREEGREAARPMPTGGGGGGQSWSVLGAGCPPAILSGGWAPSPEAQRGSLCTWSPQSFRTGRDGARAPPPAAPVPVDADTGSGARGLLFLRAWGAPVHPAYDTDALYDVPRVSDRYRVRSTCETGVCLAALAKPRAGCPEHAFTDNACWLSACRGGYQPVKEMLPKQHGQTTAAQGREGRWALRDSHQTGAGQGLKTRH